MMLSCVVIIVAAAGAGAVVSVAAAEQFIGMKESNMKIN